MRSRKQTPPELNGDHVDDPSNGANSAAADALALADEAEAEAAAAEAIAAAARARARAIRLRRQAPAAGGDAPTEVESTAAEVEADSTDVETDATDAETEASDVVAEPVDTTEVDEAVSDTKDSKDDAAEKLTKEEPVRERRRFSLRRILKFLAVGLSLVCTAALITLSVLMVINHRHQAAEQQRRAEFAAAARQGVVTLMSLDYNKAKEDVQRIIDNSTGQFKQDFQNQAEDFAKVAVESKAVTETTVTAAAVESMTDDTATVIVAASSKVTNAAGAKQEPRSWRLSVNLARDGGQMKMSKVEFVP
jgi:Mce-associated membrane protein